MKYFDVPLDHAWKVLILQELLNTRTNNLYVEGFDDYVITEMINKQDRVIEEAARIDPELQQLNI